MRTSNLIISLAVCATVIASRAGAQSAVFQSNGVPIHYVVTGPASGEPVVLIHGFSADLTIWDPVHAALSSRYRVIAIDCRGHGSSGKPHEPSAYGIEMVNDVTRLLDHLHIARAHVVGYSMGGSIALKLLETHPERLLTLTSGASTGFRASDDPGDSLLVKRLVAGEPLSQAMIESAPPGMLAPSPEQRAMMARMDAVQDARALGAQRLGNQGLYVDYARLKGSHVPVLLMVGGEDNPSRFTELRTTLPDAELVVIPGARHGDAPERPEFLASLQSFLGRHDPSASDFTAALRWRSIGPSRAGRARAAAGTSGHPTIFYIGFDNGGLWRTSDYGSNWEPLFDREATGSIGAIAVAPSNPNIIYVGTGAGIIRPDLATGNGVYKSTDADRTWTHLGLDSTLMIAMVDVDPTNPDRLFVAALGHPYGPNAERGIYRSTDGGRTFERVLYKDEYTSGNDVRIDPSNPGTIYAALWQQQQTFWEASTFGPDSTDPGAGGIYKSIDGGTTWTRLTEGLPNVLEANLAIAPSNPRVLYAMAASVNPAGGSGPVQLYKSSDGGAHWTLRTRAPNGQGDSTATTDGRPLTRIGGGDVPTIAVDPKDENVVYSASIVMWRTEDGGASWSAVRGAPGGDDYQRVWIDPNDPNLILVVSDQGAVISGNRGASWSNWYNQSTAAVYHVTADNAFPYRVCSGQQDSGSLCVASRSDDGEITFHDWHPANIQEYGIAAPDPRDPEVVFGSARRNVSRYDRRTGQTTPVGPDSAARGDKYGRNVRTMPLIWSPVRPDVLYYASNVVWRSTDHARTWTRISPDLARQTWAIPASAGKYARGVTPTPRGAITALSPSPRSLKVIWAGTDDGYIQTTSDGGATWKNVTPAAIKPWTRIFNIDAGHFDTRTAYAAANTLRIDDMQPHFWRTHDGGRTWTEIDNGVAPGTVANSIREDPRQPGLLYGGTDTQVWVSFDDGDHWQSLRLNMPAISVRDIEVKDDSTCLCADLIAGTHGRGFWILDNLSPLRHLAQHNVPGGVFLVRPQTALRVRFGTNEPTPWPPELPAGENPPAGAVLDYFLPADASGRVTLEILDARNRAVRSYASDDSILTPDPARDPAAYLRICQKKPTAPDCGLPFYWPAPRTRLSGAAGMHRFEWDMRYQPIASDSAQNAGEVLDVGAVPHRSVRAPTAPWVPPGRYTVRLTVNGRSYTQPLVLRLDPRVKTPGAGLRQLATLTTEMYQAAARVAAIDTRTMPDSVSRLFKRASNAALAAALAMDGADLAPTAAQLAACARARAQVNQVMARLKTPGRGRR